MNKRILKFKLPLAALLACVLLATSVFAGQQTAVDLQGPDYSGRVLMAQNLTTDIDSDEKLARTEKLGLSAGAAGSPPVGAQSAAEDTDSGNVRCLTPSLKHQQGPDLEQSKARNALSNYAVGDTKTIYTDQHAEGGSSFTAEVVAVGETCSIWRDAAHPELLSTEDAQAYADTIDHQIHDALYDAFGDWSAADVDSDGKTAFVFYPMAYAGFFYDADLYTKDEAAWATGNVMDMLHMNTNPWDSMKTKMSTLAHELQHLINYAQNNNHFDVWLNEAFSQSAIAIAGLSDTETVYEVKRLSDYIAETGYSYPFIYDGAYVPSGGESGIPYGTWYLFSRYLSHQTEGLTGGGDSIFKTIIEINQESMAAGDIKSGLSLVETALRHVGYMGEGKTVENIESLITNFNLAMFLREQSGVYSLGGTAEDPSNVDGVTFRRIFSLDSGLEAIPGGGAASWSAIDTFSGQMTPEGYGASVSFAGIDTEVMQGVYADLSDSSLVYGQTVALKTNDVGAKIYYTTDGADPLTQGQIYTEPIVADRAMALRACTVKDGGLYSKTAAWDLEVRLPDVAASPDSGKIVSGDRITLTSGVAGAEIRYTLDGSAPSETAGQVYTEPIVLHETSTLKVMSFLPEQAEVLPSSVKTYTYEVGVNGDRYEVNNEIDQATALSFPGRIEATLHNAADVDYYAINLDNAAILNLALDLPQDQDYSLALLDEKGEVLAQSEIRGTSQSIRRRVSSGKYLLKVASLDESASELNPYTLSMTKQMDQTALKNLDFSEMNMLTALSDKAGSDYAWDLGPNGGGHFLMSTTYFANWDGPIDETADPYAEYGPYDYKTLSDKAAYHVQNALYLPNNDREAFIGHLKNAVYSYGAADVYILSAGAYSTPDYKNFYVDSSYSYPLPGDGGHIVTIVGWDDNYSRDNFTGSPEYAETMGYTDVNIPKPQRDGAFIVKNSWGEDVGENGYFYLSYEDATVMANNPAIFMGDETSDNYNRQYINDVYGAVDFMGSDVPMAFSQKFTNSQDMPELLKAVSFQNGTEDIRYEISVTVNGQTQKVAQGVKKYMGFYTEPLDQAVTIPAGADFEITVRLESTRSDGSVSLGVTQNQQPAVSGVQPVAGIAFSEAHGQREDLGARGIFPCIRAYTCDVTVNDYVKTSLNTEKVSGQPEALASQPETVTQEGITVTGQETADKNGALALSINSSAGTEVPVRALPARFDLRETGTLTAVRNQGNLGSCWTFAAMASLESNVAGNGGFAVDHPQGISLDASEKSVLLTADAPQQAVNLTASLVGSDTPASARIVWRITGDVDSVHLDRTATMDGETAPVLTALKPGIVTVTAASDADMTVTASCQLTITAQGAESLTLTPDKLTLKPGETAAIAATALPETALDGQVVWTSDRPEIANVDDQGVVTALSGGRATITAKAGTAVATAEVTVTGAPAVYPGAGNPDTGVLQNPVLSAAVCAAILALTALGGVSYRRKNCR